MRILSLDISTKTGFAVLEGERDTVPSLLEYGTIVNHQSVFKYGGYPFSYLFAVEDVIARVMAVVVRVKPDVIVVEETNAGKLSSRYSQKVLEYLHCTFLRRFQETFVENHHNIGWKPEVYYISSSMWRSALHLQMTKEDKKNNQLLSKGKRLAEENGTVFDKATIGVKGKISKKHLSVRYVNATFNKSFKMKDNDVTDAISLGTSYLCGAKICDGVM